MKFEKLGGEAGKHSQYKSLQRMSAELSPTSFESFSLQLDSHVKMQSEFEW